MVPVVVMNFCQRGVFVRIPYHPVTKDITTIIKHNCRFADDAQLRTLHLWNMPKTLNIFKCGSTVNGVCI